MRDFRGEHIGSFTDAKDVAKYLIETRFIGKMKNHSEYESI